MEGSYRINGKVVFVQPPLFRSPSSLLNLMPSISSAVQPPLPTSEDLFAEARAAAMQLPEPQRQESLETIQKIRHTLQITTVSADLSAFPRQEPLIADQLILNEPFASLGAAWEQVMQAEAVEPMATAAEAFIRCFTDWYRTIADRTPERLLEDETDRIQRRNEQLFPKLVAKLVAAGQIDLLLRLHAIYPPEIQAMFVPDMAAQLIQTGRDTDKTLALQLARDIDPVSPEGEFRAEALVAIADSLLALPDRQAGREVIDELLALNDLLRSSHRGDWPFCIIWAIDTLFRAGLEAEAEQVYNEHAGEIRLTELPPAFARRYLKPEQLATVWPEAWQRWSTDKNVFAAARIFGLTLYFLIETTGTESCRTIIDDYLRFVREKVDNPAVKAQLFTSLGFLLGELEKENDNGRKCCTTP